MILPQKQRKLNRFKKINIKATFDNNTVSNNTAFTYVEALVFYIWMTFVMILVAG